MQQPKTPTDAYNPDYVKDPPPMVVTTEPTTVIIPPPAPKDYMTWSMLNLICCLPLGIAALIFSIKTRDANHYQDSLSAAGHSRTAFNLNMAALGFGICLSVMYTIFISSAIMLTSAGYL